MTNGKISLTCYVTRFSDQYITSVETSLEYNFYEFHEPGWLHSEAQKLWAFEKKVRDFCNFQRKPRIERALVKLLQLVKHALQASAMLRYWRRKHGNTPSWMARLQYQPKNWCFTYLGSSTAIFYIAQACFWIDLHKLLIVECIFFSVRQLNVHFNLAEKVYL